MRDPKKNCLSNVTYWMRCCLEYGMTVEDVIADFTARGQGASGRVKARQGVKASRRKENEGEEKNTPPTPPIRKEVQEKETHTLTPVCAREETDQIEADLALRQEVANRIPSLEQAKDYAASHLGKKCPPEIVEEWYSFCKMCHWCNKDGNPIHNWGYDLALYAKYYDRHKAEADPDRIPDARKGGGCRGRTPARADNWRGTPEEDLQNVF